MTYLRCTIGRWNIDLNSDEGQETLRSINDEGLRVFRSQPRFIGYRLMVAEPTTTIAVAEWESEELGKPGAAVQGVAMEQWDSRDVVTGVLRLFGCCYFPNGSVRSFTKVGGGQVDYAVHLPLISLKG
jgi:hypothetical protein